MQPTGHPAAMKAHRWPTHQRAVAAASINWSPSAGTGGRVHLERPVAFAGMRRRCRSGRLARDQPRQDLRASRSRGDHRVGPLCSCERSGGGSAPGSARTGRGAWSNWGLVDIVKSRAHAHPRHRAANRVSARRTPCYRGFVRDLGRGLFPRPSGRGLIEAAPASSACSTRSVSAAFGPRPH